MGVEGRWVVRIGGQADSEGRRVVREVGRWVGR